MNKYELIVLATLDKIDTLKTAVPYYLENLNAREIYIVANKNIKDYIDQITNVRFIDEDTVLKGMTKRRIEDVIEDITGNRMRAGWYFQQFIKLAWASRCTDKYYVVIDADTIPLNPIEFIDDKGRYLLTQKIEYHKAYFDTIDQLFNGEIKRPGDYSFIAENMIFDCGIVNEMIEGIVDNQNLVGTTFYEKILHAVDPKDICNSGFSEFETYGCYISQKFPEIIRMRKLRTSREAVYILGSDPDAGQLMWAKKDYDIISLEVNGYKSTITRLTKSAVFSAIFSMRTINKGRQRIRSLYRKLLRRPDFRYE